MKIYTKTGDKGETGIIGRRLSKASSLIDSLGTLDELNASIGIALSFINSKDSVLTGDANSGTWNQIISDLIHTQEVIFSIGGILAGGNVTLDLTGETKTLESKMDEMSTEIPPLQNFILPGGSDAGSQVHFMRAICRRAERKLVQLFVESIDNQLAVADPSKLRGDEILPYINRLSDYFFILARYINNLDGKKEVIWSGKV